MRYHVFRHAYRTLKIIFWNPCLPLTNRYIILIGLALLLFIVYGTDWAVLRVLLMITSYFYLHTPICFAYSNLGGNDVPDAAE